MGIAIRKVPSWGWIGVGTTERGVGKVVLPQETKEAVKRNFLTFDDGSAQTLAEQCVDLLARYLRGEPVDLSVVPIDWTVVPPKARPILQTLRQTVMRGQTVSYGELARRCGLPKAARLVGWAMATNPVPLLIPCHRVIRSDGSLGGFSGGVALKQRLLSLEQEKDSALSREEVRSNDAICLSY